MKHLTKKILQKTLGFNTYLYIFSLFKIYSLKFDKKENDFFFFLDLLPDDGILIDAGANIGIMSFFLSRKAKKGNVFAYEPIPENIEVLKKIKKKFRLSNLSIFPHALGDFNGETTIVMPVVDDVKMQGLSYIPNEKGNSDGVTYKTPINTLDSLLENAKLTVRGMKLDVENFEYQVLKGSTKILLRDSPLVYCELWENENRTQCLGFMKDLGYVAKVRSGKTLTPYTNQKTQNFFFIKE